MSAVLDWYSPRWADTCRGNVSTSNCLSDVVVSRFERWKFIFISLKSSFFKRANGSFNASFIYNLLFPHCEVCTLCFATLLQQPLSIELWSKHAAKAKKERKENCCDRFHPFKKPFLTSGQKLILHEFHWNCHSRCLFGHYFCKQFPEAKNLLNQQTQKNWEPMYLIVGQRRSIKFCLIDILNALFATDHYDLMFPTWTDIRGQQHLQQQWCADPLPLLGRHPTFTQFSSDICPSVLPRLSAPLVPCLHVITKQLTRAVSILLLSPTFVQKCVLNEHRVETEGPVSICMRISNRT